MWSLNTSLGLTYDSGNFRANMDAVLALAPLTAHAALDEKQLHDTIATIDERQRSGGDYRATAYLEQKEKDKPDIAQEGTVYRRSADQGNAPSDQQR